MRPLTLACPKELLPVGALPVIHRIMLELADAGIREACVVTHPDKPALETYLSGQSLPLRVRFVVQDAPKGMGDAILRARSFVEESMVLVAVGDSLIDSSEPISPVRRMLSLHEATGAGVVLGEAVPVERISRYGVMDPADPAATHEESFLLRRIVEKPAAARAPSRYAVSARYLLPASIFDALAGARPSGELGVTEPLSFLMAQGHPFYGLKLRPPERRWDIGGLATYFEAFAAYAERDLGTIGEADS